MLVTKLYITIVTYHPWGNPSWGLTLSDCQLADSRLLRNSENAEEIAIPKNEGATMGYANVAIKILPVIGGIEILGFGKPIDINKCQ